MKRKEKLGAVILLAAGLVTVGCSKRTPRHSSQLNNSSETSSISSSGKKVTKKEVKKDYKKLYQQLSVQSIVGQSRMQLTKQMKCVMPLQI